MEPTEIKENNLGNLSEVQSSSTNLLGEILVQEERLTEGELLEGLKKHQEEGGFLGQTLIDLGYITQDQLTLVLIKQCKIPHLNLKDYSIQPDISKIIPEKLCRKYNVLPIDKMGKILTVAMVDPLDGNVLRALKEVFPDLRIKPILCDWMHYQHAIKKVFGDDGQTTGSPLELDMNLAGLQKKKAPANNPKPKEILESEIAEPEAEEEKEEIPEVPCVEPAQNSDTVLTLLTDAIAQLTDTFGSQLNRFMEQHQSEIRSINERMTGIATEPMNNSNHQEEQNAVRDAVEAELSPSNHQTRRINNIPAGEMEGRLQDSLLFTPDKTAHTFEKFLPGKNNTLAVNAAKETAHFPGERFNPLFIYGPVGLGKTHLLNAIGQEILSAHPAFKIAFGTATHFGNQLIESKAAQTTSSFFDAYTDKDVLILDDIQFLGGHVDAQEEFFYVFNELQNQNGQIILAGDKPPEKLGQLEQRLISRFSSGMVVQLLPPEWETRIAILNNHVNQRKATVPEDSIAMLAMRISGDVRRLIGALIRVLSIAELQNEPVTAELTNTVLNDLGFGEAA